MDAESFKMVAASHAKLRTWYFWVKAWRVLAGVRNCTREPIDTSKNYGCSSVQRSVMSGSTSAVPHAMGH
jgi:hypothetical protein